jgi:hypothetical protein
VWRGLPMETVIKVRWWRVLAADVPRDRDSLVPWLFDWWERIDAWIAEHRTAAEPTSETPNSPTSGLSEELEKSP